MGSKEDWLEAAREELLQAALHDMRNHMSVIQGWSHLAGLDRADLTMLKGAAEALGRSVRSQSELIDDLDDVLLTPEGEGSEESSDLTEAVHAADRSIAPLRTRDLAINARIDDRPRAVVGSGRRLARLIRRGLQYAAHQSTRGGQIEIAIEDRPGSYRVRIADAGPEPVAASPPYPFHRMERSGVAPRPDRRTLILDLALIRATADRIGATVSAETRGDSPGMVMNIDIPAAGARGVNR